MPRRKIGVAEFKYSDLVPLIQHAKSTKRHLQHDGTKTGPGLLLVKDQGCYFVSNGLPRKSGTLVVYAKGYGPDCDHSILQQVFGGDDFVEFVKIKEVEHILADKVVITLTETDITIDLFAKDPIKPKPNLKPAKAANKPKPGRKTHGR